MVRSGSSRQQHHLRQVYKGKLKDGTPVAVKVQRPHVVETVSVDLYIIRCRPLCSMLPTWRFSPAWQKIQGNVGRLLWLK